MRSASVLAFLPLSTFAAPAEAYLDPDTGSILVQLLLGGVAGAAMLVKLYWRRILDLFGRGRPDHAAARDAPRP